MPTTPSPQKPRGLLLASRLARRWLAGLAAIAMLAVGMPAVADDYDDSESGHPLRIVAYVVHPIGVILDYLIFRPAHFVASYEPVKTLVGHDED